MDSPPVLFEVGSELGEAYVAAMERAPDRPRPKPRSSPHAKPARPMTRKSSVIAVEMVARLQPVAVEIGPLAVFLAPIQA